VLPVTAAFLCGCVLLNPALFSGQAPLAGKDQVFLKNGGVLQGEIVDPGRNYIELRTPLGSTKVRKRDIEKVVLGTVKTESVLDVDRLILRDGRVVKGEVTVSPDGRSVTIRILGQGSATYPRSEVVKIVPRGQPWGERPAAGPEEINKLVEDLVGRLDGAGPEAQRAKQKLKALGILAVPKLTELLQKAKGRRKTEIQSVLTSYELRKTVGDTLDEELPEIYEQLESPREEDRIDALKAALTIAPEEAVPLIAFKLRDPQETDTVRAFCVEMLRRLNRYRELVRLYNETEGATALALAVALAENGVYVGIPALIAAMTEENQKLRTFAAQKLKAYTGLDFVPPPDAPLEKWKEAATFYKAWWNRNKEKIRSQVQVLLSRKPAATPQRAKAIAKWREGNMHWSQGRLILAERAFREALDTDPTFARAALCLGMVLARREKWQEAEQYLQRVVQGRYPDVTDELQARAASELASLYRRLEYYEKAADWYKRATALYPRYVEAYLGLGDMLYKQAFGGRKLDSTKRKELLGAAEEAYRKGLKELQKYDEELVVLPAEELPVGENFPFRRQAYRKSLKTLKDYLREVRAKFAVNLARVYLALGDMIKAESVARSAAMDDPDNPTVQLLLALIFDKQGKREEALRQYRRVLRLDPANPTARKAQQRLAAHEKGPSGSPR